jgi:excisionase family DNA binding protein
MNNLLTLEEVKNYLETDQKNLEDYIKRGKLHAYKIGGSYLRFRKEEVLTLRHEVLPAKSQPVSRQPLFLSRLYDFWLFNNFYIISLVVVAALAFLVFRS